MKINTITITPSELNPLQSSLCKKNFELFEIWTPDKGDEVQVWKSKFYKKIINITILSVSNDTERLINETIDLWLELRAIREILEGEDKDDYYFKPEPLKSPYELYYEKVKEFEMDWEENKSNINQIFKKDIDPSILAYLELEDDDKMLLTN